MGEIVKGLRLNTLAANEIGIEVLRRELTDASRAALIELDPIKNINKKSSTTKLEAEGMVNCLSCPFSSLAQINCLKGSTQQSNFLWT